LDTNNKKQLAQYSKIK